MFEETKENHSGSEHVELPSREQEFAIEDAEEVVQKHSITKDKNRVISDYSANLQAATSCSEENSSETPEEIVLLETHYSGIVEMESKGISSVCSDDAKDSCNISDHQVDEENNAAESRSELQKDSRSKEEASKGETEEASTRSQGVSVSGKKKKKKKRSKRKGVYEDMKQQANQKKHSEGKNTESNATGDVTEPVIDGSITKDIEEVSTGRAEDKQDRNPTEEVKLRNPTETCTPDEVNEKSVIKDNRAETSGADNDVVKAPTTPENFDHVPDHGGQDEELNLEPEIVEPVAGVETFESLAESRTEAEEEERDDQPGLQTGSVETGAAVELNEASSDLTPAEYRVTAREEQHVDKKTPKKEERSEACSAPEESSSSSDWVDVSKSVLNTNDVDNVCVPAVAGCSSHIADFNHAESMGVEAVGDNGHAKEIKSNCTNMEGETCDSETCVLGDYPISTDRLDANNESSVCPPSGDGSQPSSSSELPSQPSAGADGQGKRINDGEDGGEESSPPILEPQPRPAEELKADLREAEVPPEPNFSPGEEKSESLSADVDGLSESEKSVEAAEETQLLGDAENQEFLCENQTDEAFIDTTNTLNNPDSQPTEALHQCSGEDQENRIEKSITLEHKISQNNQLGGLITDSSEGPDVAHPDLQESEDDGEGGQSFDFDDVDVDLAASSGPVEDERCVVAAGQRSDAQETAAAPVEGDASKITHERPAEEEMPLWAGVTEKINQAGFLPVEQGLDALQHLQGAHLVLETSPDLVVQNPEPPQALKEVKNNSKKSKAKGKEDCKMS